MYEGKVKTVEKDRQLTKDPSLQIPCVHPSKEQYGTVGMGRSRIIYIYIYIWREREIQILCSSSIDAWSSAAVVYKDFQGHDVGFKDDVASW